MQADRCCTAVTPQGTVTFRSRRLRRFEKRRSLVVAGNAFTILELLIVISIIIVLAGLILATSGYVQKKGARSRAEAEIAALSAALENYKADNGIYPTHAQRPTHSRQMRWGIQHNPPTRCCIVALQTSLVVTLTTTRTERLN